MSWPRTSMKLVDKCIRALLHSLLARHHRMAYNILPRHCRSLVRSSGTLNVTVFMLHRKFSGIPYYLVHIITNKRVRRGIRVVLPATGYAKPKKKKKRYRGCPGRAVASKSIFRGIEKLYDWPISGDKKKKNKKMLNTFFYFSLIS